MLVMQSFTAQTDIAIFGGGVAGLWLLNSLISKGFGAILLERSQLGQGQTIASQGIIHGGVKYALPGRWSKAAAAVSAMPDLWSRCVEGRGPIDLRGTRLLTDSQFLWSNRSTASRFATLVASHVMRGRVVPVDPRETTGIFSQKKSNLSLYRVSEPVIDVPSLLRKMSESAHGRLIHVPPSLDLEWSRHGDGRIRSVRISGSERGAIEVQATRFIFAAGAGNADLMADTGLADVPSQRRPLHMVLLRSPGLSPLFAHGIGTGSTPRLTITTHEDSAGRVVWYIGGGVAESGVDRTPEEQIRFCRAELQDMLPWMEFPESEWATFRVDRAEPAQPHGRRPDCAVFRDGENGCLVAWPTKLALAPVLSDMITDHLHSAGVAPAHDAASCFDAWPRPEIACPPWNGDLQWINGP